MVIQVSYQTKDDARNPHSHFTHSRFFESDSIPDKTVIIRQLKAIVGDDFDEHTISVTEWVDWDAEKMRKAGFPIKKI